MATIISREVRNIHAKLTTDISNYIDKSIDRDQFDRLKNRLKHELTPKARKDANDIFEILEALERTGFVQPGKYDKLRQILDEFDRRIGTDIINPALEEINTISSDDQRATNSSAGDISDRPRDAKKRKTEKSDHGGDDDCNQSSVETDCIVYERTKEQKGLMVIINVSKDRVDSLADVEKLTDFFNHSVKFDVEKILDESKDEMVKQLLEIRDAYLTNSRMAKKYYCFVCVVMSHGNENGICTTDDKVITIEEIIMNFKNQQLKGFLGKPKVFIVQSCRGCSTQPSVEADDIGEKIISLPDDADILIAYATTPGYKAFRTVYSEIGAWFIHGLLEVTKKEYKKKHLEEMLITVRHKLATEEQYRKNEYRQMPCVWTTLTKRLYFYSS